ncbi:MAG: DNA polymerase III subunit delta, partial [Prochlorococcus sp.]
FVLPAIWDGAGQRELVERTARDLNLQLEVDATTALVEAIGNDSTRLKSELQKLALHAETYKEGRTTGEASILISIENVAALIEGMATNALQVGDSLLAGQAGEAIARLDALL